MSLFSSSLSALTASGIQRAKIMREQQVGVTTTSIAGIANWEQLPHKGMERPADCEFPAIIDGLGKAFADARTDEEYAVVWEDIAKYAAQYVSAVSPDRRSLAEEAAGYVAKAARDWDSKCFERPEKDGPRTLFDYLGEDDQEGRGPKKVYDGLFGYDLPSGGRVTAQGSSLALTGLEVKSPLGQTVLHYSYSSGTWSAALSPQEETMNQDFYSRVHAAAKRHQQANTYRAMQTCTPVDRLV